MRLENAAHLVGRDGVDAAAERDELHQVDGLLGAARADEFCRRVQPRMIGPLVEHARFCPMQQAAERVLADDDGAHRADKLVDAVVDFRVEMIGTAAEHDDRQPPPPRFLQRLLALPADLRGVGGVFGVGCVRR